MQIHLFSSNIEVRMTQIFVLVTALLFGGFYEFAGCSAAVFLIIVLVWLRFRKKQLRIYLNYNSIAISVLCMGYGLAVFYGTDSGMAFLGFLKILSVLLFAVVVMQFSREEKDELFHIVPHIGCIIIGVGILSMLTGIKEEMFFMSGRFGGTFQYSNTMALFFLIGIIICRKENIHKWLYLLMLTFLYAGILMTGSRSVFVIAILYILISGIVDKEKRVGHIALVCLSVIGGLIYTGITADFQNIGRFLTISMKSSTLMGRLLYWQDAVQILKEHFWGLGSGGYSYLQGLYQTGVYQVQYVHNEYLQFMLDAGVLPAVIFLVAAAINLISKKIGKTAKQILALILFHSFFDFNLQFLSIFYLMILCTDHQQGKQIIWSRKGKCVPQIIGSAVFAAVFGYFAIVTLAYYRGEDETAYKMFPAYTEAGSRILENSTSLESAEITAENILKTNSYAAIAYSTKALVGLSDHQYEVLTGNQKKAIELCPYDIQMYTLYCQMLIKELEYHEELPDEIAVNRYKEELTAVPDMLAALKQRASYLGNQINDSPDLELPDEIGQYIESLCLTKATSCWTKFKAQSCAHIVPENVFVVY